MGFVGSLLSNSMGAGFKADGTRIDSPVNVDQANTAYAQSQNGLDQQQQFINALASQNGAGNLQNVFSQYQGVANGTGPNPAQAQLAQATGNNVANQAALMAGQRGAGANAGLLARQIAGQGANTQQQAAGQAASLQAQQQLNALGAMGNIAQGQVGNQQQALSVYNQGALNQQSNLLGGINAQNQARVSMQGNQNSANAGIAQGNQAAQAGILGGALGAAGTAFGLAHGGSVPGYAAGGTTGPQSFAGRFLSGAAGGGNASAMSSGISSLGKGIGSLFHKDEAASAPMPSSNQWADYMQAAPGQGADMQAAMMSPDQHLGAPMAPEATAEQIIANPSMQGGYGLPGNTMMASNGGKVPGKAKVFGDNQVNDTVPAKLSPGEIVIPRSILQSHDPVQAAAHFVHQELQKHQMMAEGGTAGQAQPPANQEWADRWAKMSKGFTKGPKLYAQGGVAQDDSAPPVVVNVNSGAPDPNAPSVMAQPPIPQKAQPVAEAPMPMGQPGPMLASNGPGVPQGGMPKGLASGLGAGEIASQMPADQSSDPYGYSGYLSNMQKGIGQQMAGVTGEAKATGALGREQAAVEAQHIQKLQDAQTNYQQNYAGLEKERSSFMHDIENQHLNPDKYLGNMGTGQKVRTAIGLILGGIGGGLLHQENPALKYLNSQIDRDIDAQKSELGKKESLLSMNMKQFGNLNDATNMTRVQQLAMAESQLKKAAAEAQDPISKARAQAAIGQLQQQAAPILQQIAMKKTFTSGMQGGDTQQKLTGLIRSGIIPEGQSQAVFKEYQEAANLDKARQTVLDAHEKIAKINTLGNRVMNPIQAKKQVNDIIAAVVPKLSKDTAGRFTEQDADYVKDLFSTFTANKDSLGVQKNQLNKLFTDKASFPQLDAYGVNPFGKGRYAPSGENKIKLGPPKV